MGGVILCTFPETPTDLPQPPSHALRMDDEREADEFAYALYLARQKRADNGEFRRAFGLLGYKRPADGGVAGRGYRYTDGV